MMALLPRTSMDGDHYPALVQTEVEVGSGEIEFGPFSRLSGSLLQEQDHRERLEKKIAPRGVI